MVYELTIPQFTKMLRNLKAILGKAGQYAETKKFDMDVLLQSRLAPDQFNMMRQLQIACDTAKLGVARLSDKDAPVHEDNEKTLSEINSRIDQVIGFLNSFSPSDFNGSEQKKIYHPRWDGKYLMGDEFVLQHVLPNFYFHITTAYAILRHNGLDIGKKDYLGEMPYKK